MYECESCHSMCMTWLIHIRTCESCHYAYVCVTWLTHIHMCDVTHSYSYAWVLWLWIRMRDMTHSYSYVWVLSYGFSLVWKFRTWINHVTYEWVISHMHEPSRTWTSHVAMNTYVWHDSLVFICVTWLIHIHMCDMSFDSSLVWTGHVTRKRVMSHMNESCYTWTSHVAHEWVIAHVNEACLRLSGTGVEIEDFGDFIRQRLCRLY